jgi:2-(1,2-epoxy-1,2-dihydrophenyl)acetyl-CoA isomerase
MSFETLLYVVADGIGIVTLNRPEARNALDLQMRAELARLVSAIRADESVRVVIITGAGSAFCAGGDLRAMARKRRTAEESRRRIHDLHVWLPELVNLEKPVIAAVDGPAFGGGLSLALAADFILATPRARFCAVFARIGLVPDMACMYLLPRIVGLARAKDLIFSARVFDAKEARSLGIVTSLHTPGKLLEDAIEFARRFLHASTLSIGLAKNILNQSHQLDQHALAELESYAQALCMDSSYHDAAVQAFIRGNDLAFRWEAMEKTAATRPRRGRK